jgi:hypothetical protein
LLASERTTGPGRETEEGDRRSERARALDLLARRESIHIRELPKAMQDAFLRANYPNWRDNENNL